MNKKEAVVGPFLKRNKLRKTKIEKYDGIIACMRTCGTTEIFGNGH